jgi:tetratricopeptide (TPR) repeat protein
MRNTFKIEASRELAKSLWREGKFDEAREVLAPVARLVGVPRDLTIATSCVLSIIEQCSGRPRAAIAVLRASEGLVRATTDMVLLGQWLNTMGINHRLVRSYEPAFSYLIEAVEAHERGGAVEYAAQSRANIGNLFLDLGQTDAALSYLEEALRRCETPEAVGQVLESKARALMLEGKADKAEGCARTAVAVLNGAGVTGPLIDAAYRTLGVVTFAREHAPEGSAK